MTEANEKVEDEVAYEKKWYIIHTYSGYEKKVAADLEKRIESLDLTDRVFRILVPEEEVLEEKRGKMVKVPRKLFPSYVMIEMLSVREENELGLGYRVDSDAWYVIRNTNGVTGFVGVGSDPIPLSDEEATDLLSKIGIDIDGEEKAPRLDINFKVGEVVAVTGDGVNDAPALKKADIGVAMGISGTDVAKESADMILTDDHFASIVHAVEEGRAVYRNIQRFLTYIFNSNTPEAVPSTFFLFSLGRIPLPLTVMQILAIDLGTDMMPALGLGVEPPEEGIMDRPPRRLSDRLLNRQLLLKAFAWYGMIESVLAMGAFFLNYWVSQGHLNHLASSGPLYREATTMTLGAIIFTQIGMAMNSRKGRGSIFKIKPFANKIISLGIILEIILFIILSYVPLFHTLFNTAPIGFDDWLYLLVCPFIIMALEEIRHRLFD